MIKFVAHRVNRLEKLERVPENVGAEVDIRIGHAKGSNELNLVMSHDPWVEEISFEEFLQAYSKEHKDDLLVLNVKTTGIEAQVLELTRKYGVRDYFLLDVEPPYLYNATKKGVHELAVRVSEYEPFEILNNFRGMADWAWIDTATVLPLDEKVLKLLEGYKTCLVCPERWGRPEDIAVYAEQMKKLSFEPTAIMTAIEHIDAWKQAYGMEV